MPDDNLDTLEGIDKHFDKRKSDEARVLGYFQRMNMAGLDYKGQISTAYAEHGTSLAVNASVDFNKILIPFCHVTFGGGYKHERTSHALLVIQRFASRVWSKNVEIPAPPAGAKAYPLLYGGSTTSALTAISERSPPTWTTKKPLMFAQLEGKTRRHNLNVAAKAYVGLTKNFDDDETGLSIGVGGEGEADWETTKLYDPNVRHFGPSAYDSKLAGYVDDIIARDLKQRVAIWILSIVGTPETFKFLDIPGTLADKVAEYETFAGLAMGKLEGLGKDKVIELAKANIKAIEESGQGDRLPEWLPSGAAASLAQKMSRITKDMISDYKSKKHLKKSGLSVDDMETRVKDVAAILDKDLAFWTRNGSLAMDQREAKFSDEFIKNKLELLKFQKAQSATLLKTIARAKQYGIGNQQQDVPPTNVRWPHPLCHLSLHANQRWGKVSGGGNMTLPFSLAGARAAIMKRWGSRFIAFRYQSFAQGRSGGKPTTMVTTQDATIRYNLTVFEAKASAELARGWKEGEKSHTSRQWATMTYQVDTAVWQLGSPSDSSIAALPNGSGQCFGLSVLAGRFEEYAQACKAALGPLTLRPQLSEDSIKLEEAMMKILRVTETELRGFMASAAGLVGEDPNADIGAIDDPTGRRERVKSGGLTAKKSIIIESNFALTRVSHCRLINGQVEELSGGEHGSGIPELNKHRNVRTNDVMGNRGTMRLSAIRLRHRIAAKDDNGHDKISLGVSMSPATQIAGSDPFATPKEVKEKMSFWEKLIGFDPSQSKFQKLRALMPSLGFKYRRMSQIGTEGLFDLHVKHFPEPFSKSIKNPERRKQIELLNLKEMAEISVSPAMLFSQ